MLSLRHPVPLQQFNRFSRDLDVAGRFCLGCGLVGSLLRGIAEVCANLDPCSIQIDLRPLQCGDFPSAAPRDEEQVGKCLPLDRFLIQSTENVDYLLRLEVVRRFSPVFWRDGLFSCIIGDQHFSFCHVENRVDEAVMFQYSLTG